MRHVLPAASPPRFPAELPRGPELWTPERTLWTDENTDGLFVCDLVNSAIRLTKGSNRGELVELRHWQGDIYCDMYRLDEDGLRMYRVYQVWVARKNSKSLLGSGAALNGLVDEPGAEVYSCAGDKEQAKIVFKELREAIEMSPELDAKQGGLFKVYKDVIEYPPLGSIYRALSAEAFTKEGLNPSLVLFDELHAQPDDELWNVMNEGSGTREQPLVLVMSTFGKKVYSDGTDSIGFRQYQYCKQVISGERDDPSLGCRIYETPPKVDHRDPKVWPVANPALGDFLSEEDMQAKCLQMAENDFRTKRLNIWVEGATAWLPSGWWARLVHSQDVPDDTEVVLAFDGSYNNDSTALIGVTLDGYVFVVEAWERPLDDPNWVVPRSEVDAEVRRAMYRWRVVEFTYDPAGWARDVEAWKQEWGDTLPDEPFGQSNQRMGPACALFYAAVAQAVKRLVDGGEPDGIELRHDGDPRLERHLRNCVTKETPNGAVIVKDRRGSPRKIDLAVGAVMGFSRAMWWAANRSEGNSAVNAYTRVCQSCGWVNSRMDSQCGRCRTPLEVT